MGKNEFAYRRAKSQSIEHIVLKCGCEVSRYSKLLFRMLKGYNIKSHMFYDGKNVLF